MITEPANCRMLCVLYLQVSDLIAQLEKLRSEAAMMEARKGGLCVASVDPQLSSITIKAAIIPAATCPVTGPTGLPSAVEAADAAAASISNGHPVSLGPCPQPTTMVCQHAPSHAAASTASDKAAPPMRPRIPERQLPPEAQSWGLQDCRSWAGEQEWSSWAEVQAFTKMLEPTLAEAIREGSRFGAHVLHFSVARCTVLRMVFV